MTARTVENTVKYYYDSEGKLTRKVFVPAGGTSRTTYYENSSDQMVVKFAAGGRSITAHSKSDSFGRKVFDELQLGTGFLSRQFSYHAGQVTQEHKEARKLKSTATTQLVSRITFSDGRALSYDYDAEERITSVMETYTVDGQAVVNTTTYTYDAMGQLLTETVNGEVVNTMTYDCYGNITSKNGVVYTYGDSVWKDRLSAYDGEAITYDAQGNPTNYLGHTLTWEKGRQLKSFDNIQYTYNANGIRTGKTVNGVQHTYTLEGSKILQESWSGNTLVPLYDNEDSVCGILYNNTPFYFQKNLQGDVIAIANANSNIVARYSYDAWGKCTVLMDTSGSYIASVNPFRYRGYYYDSEIGMYYLQSRYYDPEVGRFINADYVDSLLVSERTQGVNLYAYCENNPCNHSDPLGKWIQYVVGAVIGGVLNVVFYAIDCAIARTKMSLWKALLNFLNGAINGVIAATGAGLIWQIVAGITSGIVSLFIGATRPTFEDLIIAIICGILSGVLAGTLPKSAGKHINYLMSKFGKKFANSLFKSSFGKTLLNAAKYVFKNSKTLLWRFIKSYCVPNFYIAIMPRIKALLGV